MIPRRRKRDTFLPWVQLAVDIAASMALLQLTFWFRFRSGIFQSTLGAPDHHFYHRSFWFVTIVVVLFLRNAGLYKPARIYTFLGETAKVFQGVLLSTVLLMAFTFFYRSFTFSRLYLIITGLVLGVGLSLSRVLLGLAVMAVDRWRHSYRNIVIIGLDEPAQKLIQYYLRNPRFSARVVGLLDDRLPIGSTAAGVPVLGRSSDLQAVLENLPYVHEVVLSGQGHTSESILSYIYACERSLVQFRWIADVFGLIASKMSVSYLAGMPLLSFTDSPLLDWENRLSKRTMDVFLSLFGLTLTALLFVPIALAIKWSSKGPVFYRQKRVGEDGRNFTLYKFRTMRADAESASGPVWATPNDPRRTKVGAFLRENNLDELPQLWNVLKGEMSLVGPRPERPHFVSRFKDDIPRYMARHSIKSGITGWAQVNGLRGDTSIEERTKYDLYYIENWSLLFDLKILFMTFFARRNAY